MGVIGHELLSFLFLFVHKNLSTLDPSSLAYGIAALFNSRRKQSSLLSPSPPIIKAP